MPSHSWVPLPGDHRIQSAPKERGNCCIHLVASSCYTTRSSSGVRPIRFITDGNARGRMSP
eukprot:3442672-Pyramimonas_sp.AAC.1